MKINSVGPNNSFRLVYNETEVLCLIETSGYTSSMYSIYEADTKEACLAEIMRLGLIYVEQPLTSE